MSTSKQEKSHTTEFKDAKSLCEYTSFNDAYGIRDEEKYAAEGDAAEEDLETIGVWGNDHAGGAALDDSNWQADDSSWQASAWEEDGANSGGANGDDEGFKGASRGYGRKRPAIRGPAGVRASVGGPSQKRMHVEHNKEQTPIDKIKEEKANSLVSRLRADLEKVASARERDSKIKAIKEMLHKRSESLYSATGLTEDRLNDIVSSLQEEFGSKVAATAPPSARSAPVVPEQESQPLPDSIEGWKEAQARLFGHLPKPPAGWIRIKSRSKDVVYFYNESTGVSKKEMPDA